MARSLEESGVNRQDRFDLTTKHDETEVCTIFALGPTGVHRTIMRFAASSNLSFI